MKKKQFLIIFVAVTLGMAVRSIFFESYIILSESMEPTILVGDHVIVDKTVDTVLSGDVIAFREMGGDRIFFKRVTAAGGETVNGIDIPKDKMYVVGDNFHNSVDSRKWGPVPTENLIGKAKWIWLSCEETIWDRCNPLTMRWERVFNAVK